MSIWDTPTLRREIDKMQDALDMLCPGAVVQLEHDTGQAADIKCIKLPIPHTAGEHFLVRRNPTEGGWCSAKVTRSGTEKPLVTADPSFMRVLRGVVGHMLVWQDSKAAAMHAVAPASVPITDADTQRLMAATGDAEPIFTGAKRDIHAAALDEYRSREVDFTDADIQRFMAATGDAESISSDFAPTFIDDEAKPQLAVIPFGGSTPYDQLRQIVVSYGHGPFMGESGAKHAVYDAALIEYRDRKLDFTHNDLKRVIAAASAAGA
jgi:hypothetical protein